MWLARKKKTSADPCISYRTGDFPGCVGFGWVVVLTAVVVPNTGGRLLIHLQNVCQGSFVNSPPSNSSSSTNSSFQSGIVGNVVKGKHIIEKKHIGQIGSFHAFGMSSYQVIQAVTF